VGIRFIFAYGKTQPSRLQDFFSQVRGFADSRLICRFGPGGCSRSENFGTESFIERDAFCQFASLRQSVESCGRFGKVEKFFDQDENAPRGWNFFWRTRGAMWKSKLIADAILLFSPQV
jgi:hypothetical protein